MEQFRTRRQAGLNWLVLLIAVVATTFFGPAETHAVNYGGDSGIIIDRCTGCRGFWLDKGELEKIQMLVEGWDDALPDDLAKHGAKLRDVAAKMDANDDVRPGRFGFINSIVNGILDFGT